MQVQGPYPVHSTGLWVKGFFQIQSPKGAWYKAALFFVHANCPEARAIPLHFNAARGHIAMNKWDESLNSSWAVESLNWQLSQSTYYYRGLDEDFGWFELCYLHVSFLCIRIRNSGSKFREGWNRGLESLRKTFWRQRGISQTKLLFNYFTHSRARSSFSFNTCFFMCFHSCPLTRLFYFKI